MRTLRLIGVLCAFFVVSCGKKVEPPVDLAQCKGLCADGPLLAVATVKFLEANADGTAPGYDLDGVDGPVAIDCSANDYVSPEGTRGVDNQMATLLPVLKNLVGEALPTLIQNSVNEGGLSIIMEFVGLDDPQNDEDVNIVFHRGQGTPLLDADGRLLAGQTYELADDTVLGVCRSGKLVNGKLHCSGFDLRVTIVVFGVTYRLTFRDLIFDMDLASDLESASLVFGGTVLVDDIIGVANTIGDIAGLDQTIKDAVPPFADIQDPTTGACNRISGTLAMSARLGFVFGK
jgi:hypothetical protein